MPTNFSALDQNLPRFTGEESTERKVEVIQDYLYQLLEALRYKMGNLDTRNFNQTALSEYAGSLTDPIYKRLTDSEGNITNLELTAKGLQMQISDNAGNIHSLSATADKLQSQISDNAGSISTLTQTATGLGARISATDGRVTSLSASLDGITARVADAEGNVSSLTQTATSLSASISNATGRITTVETTINGLTVADENGETFISGSRIKTNSITATQIDVASLRVDTLYAKALDVNGFAQYYKAVYSVPAASGAQSTTLCIGGDSTWNFDKIVTTCGKGVYIDDGRYPGYGNALFIDMENRALRGNSSYNKWSIGNSTYPMEKICCEELQIVSPTSPLSSYIEITYNEIKPVLSYGSKSYCGTKDSPFYYGYFEDLTASGSAGFKNLTAAITSTPSPLTGTMDTSRNAWSSSFCKSVIVKTSFLSGGLTAACYAIRP